LLAIIRAKLGPRLNSDVSEHVWQLCHRPSACSVGKETWEAQADPVNSKSPVHWRKATNSGSPLAQHTLRFYLRIIKVQWLQEKKCQFVEACEKREQRVDLGDMITGTPHYREKDQEPYFSRFPRTFQIP
jgi:hypothetical protein